MSKTVPVIFTICPFCEGRGEQRPLTKVSITCIGVLAMMGLQLPPDACNTCV